MKAVALVLLAIAMTQAQEKIVVDIYYESLCGDSLNFIKTQLYPNYDKIASCVTLNLVPFGKSSSYGSGFTCQHGPEECRGNMIQSCVLDQLKLQKAQVEYVNCFMSVFNEKRSYKEFGRACAEKNGADWKTVMNCYNGQRGVDLQLQAEAETKTVPASFIPTIVIQKEFNQNNQHNSLRHFPNVVDQYCTKTY